MIKYLKSIARSILRSELNDYINEVQESRKEAEALSREKEKLEKKIKRMDDPETILLAHYRIDNVDTSGMPPSYLDPKNPTEYLQHIQELESVFRNKSFRELVAWSLNFHANISVTGRVKNQQGDEVEISSEKANDMIRGIRAIWELVVGAHNKERQIAGDKNFDKFAMMEIEYEE